MVFLREVVRNIENGNRRLIKRVKSSVICCGFGFVALGSCQFSAVVSVAWNGSSSILYNCSYLYSSKEASYL